jgi:hypothetical protein
MQTLPIAPPTLVHGSSLLERWFYLFPHSQLTIEDWVRITEQWNIRSTGKIVSIRFDGSIVKPEGMKRGRYCEQQART